MLDGIDRGIGYVEGVVAQAHQAEPAGLVVTGEELEAAQAPVHQRVAFDVGDELGVGHHAGAEHRHAPGHGQHALGQGHRAHVDVALGEAQFVPLAHDVAAAHFAEFVGGQATDIAEQLEPGHSLAHHAGFEHGVAVDHRDHGILVRQVPGNRAEAIGQAITLAGTGNAHEVQFDVARRVELGPQAFHQQLVGHLHQRADHGGRVAAGDRLADDRAVDLGGGQRIDAKAGDHQKYVGRVSRRAQLAHLAPQVRVDHVEEQHAAHKVRGTHGVTPDTHRAHQENEVLRLRVENGLGQHQGNCHEQAQVEQPTGSLE
ncbi:hypothetical protein D3C76_799900 [compost metagenome]